MVPDSVYWIYMNDDIDETLNNCHIYLDIQAKQPKDKTVLHEIPGGPWKFVDADTFTI